MRQWVKIVGFMSLLAAAFAAQSSWADQVQHLVWMGSELRSTWTNVSVITDSQGNLLKLAVGGTNNDAPTYYDVNQIRQGWQIHVDGINDSNHALYLHGPALDPRSGGPVTLKYLRSGFGNGTYRDLDLALVRKGDQWALTLQGSSQSLKSLYLHKNTEFGILIGIHDIAATLASLPSGWASTQSVDEVAVSDIEDKGGSGSAAAAVAPEGNASSPMAQAAG